jgi:DNA polymerase II large subunit
MSATYREYVSTLENGLSELYKISDKAKQMGLDPSLTTECKIAKDLADLVEGLVGPIGVASSIRELSSKLAREELAFKVAEEIVYGKFGHMEPEVAADQAIRTALAVLTEGLTAAPLQGIAKVSIKVNSDKTHYLAVYFAGPMRSAGGTDQALTLVVGDFVRRLLGLDRYKPTEDEISRFIEELRLYQRNVTRFQYHAADEELRKALQWLPVEVTGTESDPIEVSTFRNLPRVETNRVRGGALRVVNDGVVGRAQKVYGVVEKLGIQGWDWLREFNKKSEQKSAGFMDDVIAGRPIFSFPSCKGGFRLRYGRARNTGLSAVGIHPATMSVLQDFLAGGTQVRLELPGKGGIVVPVDSIEPPIVLLKDKSVMRVKDDNWFLIKDKVDKVLFLGDILISFGDFLYNNRGLEASGYTEEWWVFDLRELIVEKLGGDFEKAAEMIKTPRNRLLALLNDPYYCKPSITEAIAISKALQVPLHPSFTFFWSNADSPEEIKRLRSWFLTSEVTMESGIVARITGKSDVRVKKTLEDICVPHRNEGDVIVIEDENATSIAFCLGYEDGMQLDYSATTDALSLVCLLSRIEIREKAPTFVGARMGRPEKAKRREMKPLVHALFPVGLSGGSQRDISEAAKKPPVFVDMIKRKCPECKTFTYKILCPICGTETLEEKICPNCGKNLNEVKCPSCNAHTVCYQKQVVNFKELLVNTCENLGVLTPKLLKGVKGLTSATKTPEMLEKGILRAKHALSVYKDGTVRFDATNAPLTHFKPCEIGVTVEKLRELGYALDSDGKKLTDTNQICELKIQDIIIPLKCGEYFVQVANFVDEMLTRAYKLEPYYNAKSSGEIVGELVVGLAPHTCAGILGRVIGFTKLSVCYAHPIWHSAKRRDCDGDEDAVILALDVLINFSRKYLPAQIGGIMDAPILLIPVVKTKDVQRQAHDFDVASSYSTQFFKKTLEKAEAKQVSSIIDLIGHRLDTEAQFEGFGFTIPVSDVNAGNLESVYKQFKTMLEKLDSQLELAEKIKAVNVRRVAFKVLTTHFMKDISGNLRAFSTQSFRCKSCNKRFRRLPLRGKCSICGGQLTLTVYRGGIEKYMDAAQKLVEKYKLPKYYAQRINLVREEIDTMFSTKKSKQISLTEFT